MASRTIENDRDRTMTIMTTTFIPCGAKLPIIALVAGAFFGNAWLGRPQRLLRRNRGHCMLGHYSQENPACLPVIPLPL